MSYKKEMEESKKNRDSGKKPENSDTETDEETLHDLDQKKSSPKQQGYTDADLEMPAPVNEDLPDFPPLPTNRDQLPPWD
jgi:hypothetical protein